MGLDMYVYQVKQCLDNTDFEPALLDFDEEFMYWRKNRFLHNWIFENVYIPKKKAINDAIGDFNCEFVRLNIYDLLRLKKDIINKNLPNTHGFFWGDHDYDDDMQNEDLKFIEHAINAIEQGYDLYYYSSW